ncbi:hypothetical protein J6P92_04650 [bacterium]|nr:hypothetical protein [bacterium]
MQVQRIQNNNTNYYAQRNLSFQAKGDILKIHGADFIDCGDHFISKLPLDKIKQSAASIENETNKNLEILRQFKPENIKQYLLELVEYAKGKKQVFQSFKTPITNKDEKSVMHLYLKEQPLNQPTRYLDTASDEMRDYLRKGSKPFVIDDKEGKQWIVSTHMGDYSEAYWGPVGVDVTPLEHLK